MLPSRAQLLESPDPLVGVGRQASGCRAPARRSPRTPRGHGYASASGRREDFAPASDEQPADALTDEQPSSATTTRGLLWVMRASADGAPRDRDHDRGPTWSTGTSSTTDGSTRSVRPRRPDLEGSAPPRPSSAHSTRTASRTRTSTLRLLAPECLATLARLSATTKYSVPATPRRPRSPAHVSEVGTGHRSASSSARPAASRGPASSV